MKTAPWVVMASLILPLQIAAARPQQTAPATGRQQEDPLAAAAAKAREQQKKDGKAPKVWSNDNLPTAGGISVVGQTPAAAAAADSARAPGTAPEARANSPELSRDQLAGLYGEPRVGQAGNRKLENRSRHFAAQVRARSAELLRPNGLRVGQGRRGGVE